MNKKLNKDIKLDDMLLKNFINLTNKEKELVRRWRNNKNVRKWMFSHHIISKEEHNQFLENLKTNKKKYYWLVKAYDSPLGVISLTDVDFKNKNTSGGFYANQDCRIFGAGLILFRLIIKIAFDILKLHTIHGQVLDGNEIVGIHKKLGFIEEGRLKEFLLRDGRWKDIILTVLINKDAKIKVNKS